MKHLDPPLQCPEDIAKSHPALVHCGQHPDRLLSRTKGLHHTQCVHTPARRHTSWLLQAKCSSKHHLLDQELGPLHAPQALGID